MDSFFTSIPTTPIGWIALAVVSTLAVVYLLSKTRESDMKILRNTNKDQGDRITLLEAAVKRLENQVIDLQHQNKTLNDLVVVALKQYFFENPKLAESIKDKVIPVV